MRYAVSTVRCRIKTSWLGNTVIEGDFLMDSRSLKRPSDVSGAAGTAAGYTLQTYTTPHTTPHSPPHHTTNTTYLSIAFKESFPTGSLLSARACSRMNVRPNGSVWRVNTHSLCLYPHYMKSIEALVSGDRDRETERQREAKI